MSPEPPDYEAMELQMWRENAKQVVTQLNGKDTNLMKQIHTFMYRFGYSQGAVEKKIRSDQMFAANFTREPRRQSFHEKAAAQWLRENIELDVEVLPQSGKNAMYVTRDGMITKLPLDESRPSKALDFFWRYQGTDFYAMHKYTREGGGNQDSQFKEMVQLLTNYLSASNTKHALMVIVDGPYYTPAKLKELESKTRQSPPLSFAGPIEKVPDILAKHYQRQNQAGTSGP